MEIYDAFLLILAGLIAGFINAVAGGGSLITIPFLIELGLLPTVANATNRVAIVIQNIFAVSGFKSKGVSSFPYSFWLAGVAVIGAFIGARIAVEIDEVLFKKILAIVMLIVIILTIFKPGQKVVTKERLGIKQQVIGAFTFFFLGIYGGFIQAGVGFLIIAALSSINHFSLAKSNAVKVFVALIYTLAAVVYFAIEGKINWQYGLILSVGNSVGAWLSSRWSVKIGDKYVRWFLIVVVFGMAIKLWFF